MLQLCRLLLLTVILSAAAFYSAVEKKPYGLWVVSEANSSRYMEPFFSGGAESPAIETLAAHGLTFDRALYNGAVCSVATTALATACYGPRIGAQNHRRYSTPSSLFTSAITADSCRAAKITSTKAAYKFPEWCACQKTSNASSATS